MKTAILKSTCIALLMGNMFSCDVLDVEHWIHIRKTVSLQMLILLNLM